MVNKVITIREWGYLDLGYSKIMALLDSCPDCFEPCKKGNTIQVRATRYVGTVCFDDGCTIEVLPKIESSDEAAKSLLERMIRSVYLRPKQYGESPSNSVDDSLLEFFVRLFCWEANEIFKKGVTHGYTRKDENLSSVKGRILFTRDLKKNVANRSKVFVSHEVYSDDRPENRIMLMAVKTLKKITHDSENMHQLMMIENSFVNVSPISDYKMEFRKCTHDRSSQHYERILDICKVILDGSQSIFSGDHVSISLMFDMDVLYQDYVAKWMRRNYPEAIITLQDRSKRLFGQFVLKPDIVMRYKGRTYILDTKWKIIKNENGVSSDDAQQLYSYITQYENCSEGFLLYPKSVGNHDQVFTDGKESLHLSFIDLFDIADSYPIPTN